MQPQEKKEVHVIPRIPRYQPPNYGRWQQSKRPRLNLPQIKDKVTSGKWVSKWKTSSRSSRSDFTRTKSTTRSVSATSMGKNQSQKTIENENEPEKIQTNVRILRAMLKFRKASLDELGKQVASLTLSNQELAKKIQDIEAVTAEKVRRLLQQQDMFGTLIGTLEYANHKQMQDMKNKLEKWEVQAKAKVNELQKQLTKVKAKIHKAQEELNFLNTYMDHEYPIKSVQIANLLRQIQDVKDSNQDELEELEEVRKDVLQTLSKKLMVKAEKVLYVMAKSTILPYQAALMRKTLSNQRLLKQMVQFRVHIDHMKRQLPKLKAQVDDLRMQRKDSREVVFANVLLRKPKRPVLEHQTQKPLIVWDLSNLHGKRAFSGALASDLCPEKETKAERHPGTQNPQTLLLGHLGKHRLFASCCSCQLPSGGGKEKSRLPQILPTHLHLAHFHLEIQGSRIPKGQANCSVYLYIPHCIPRYSQNGHMI
ncbi:uncharacterized protein C20orf96 homolog isoform X2 [Dromiciops gliroides]|uniref:uncharacterized protein C20orf96 homolog isoform X2 n=1 Tax=Dromiciops gliroides TaxID=33562 RepID=UPI001CC36014|nr:uncharacterized protein C20orf96 homolog isoform X2 [Dromiciops gliroides]